MTHHGIPESALDNHIAILGKTGSGKTNLAKVITEDLLGQDRRVCVIDPTGVWWGLRLMPDGKTRSEHSCVIFGGQHGDLPLFGSQGEAIAKVVATTSTPVILDVLSLTGLEQAQFFTDFANTLVSSNRGELTLIIDEAHKFMPQAGSGAGRASSTMLYAGNNLVSLGRGRGLRIILICQRPSKLHKDALTQVETLVSMRFTAPQDHKAIAAWIEDETSNEFDPVQLKYLPVGDAWVWYPEHEHFERVHSPLAATFNSSRVRSQAIVDLPKIDVGEIEALLTNDEVAADGDDSEVLRRQITDLKRELRERKTNVVDEEEVSRRINAAIAVERKRVISEVRSFLHGLSGEIHRFEKRLEDVPQKEVKRVDTSKRTVVPTHVKRNGSQADLLDAGDLTAPQQRVLQALGWLSDLGIADCASRLQVAFLAGYKPKGGAFSNTIGSLRSGGYLDYPSRGTVALTSKGRALVPVIEKPVSTEDLQDAVMARLTGPQRKLLKPLIDVFPGSLSVGELALASGYESGGGAFNNIRGSLRTLGIVDYPEAGRVVAKEVLFLN